MSPPPPRPSPSRRRRGGGFTLLEVLVALTILAVAIVAFIQLSSQGLRLLHLADDYQQAVVVADRVARATDLVEEGTEGDDLYLLLDGVLGVEVGGEPVAEMGPGTMLGERASLEGGVRTATLRALTPCRVAVVPPELVAEREMAALAAERQREA